MGSSTLSTNTSRCSEEFLLFLPCQSWHKVKDFLVIQDTELLNLPIVLLNQLMELLNQHMELLSQLTLHQNQLVILLLLILLRQNPWTLLPWLFLLFPTYVNLTTVRRSFQENGPVELMQKVQDVYQAVLEDSDILKKYD